MMNALRKLFDFFLGLWRGLRALDRKIVWAVLLAGVVYFILTPKWEVLVVNNSPAGPVIYNVMAQPGVISTSPSGVRAPGAEMPGKSVPMVFPYPAYAVGDSAAPDVAAGYRPSQGSVVVVKFNKFSGQAYIWNQRRGWTLLP